MMKVFCFVVLAVVMVSAQRGYHPGGYQEPPNVPIPYSFSYTAQGDEGQSAHQETGDGHGRVQGSYSYSDAYGLNRVVEYVADEGGYRAVVRTNEPGTANENPADVVIESSASGAHPTHTGGVSPPRPRPDVRPRRPIY